MLRMTTKTRNLALGVAAAIALPLILSSPSAKAQQYWTPADLSAALVKEFGSDVRIEGGVLYVMKGDGTQHTYIVDPSNAVSINRNFTTFSTGISKGYKTCPAADVVYTEWAGPMIAKWCVEVVDVYKAKSAYYYYNNRGGYDWIGSQRWNCDLQTDYDSMPPPVRIAACQ